MPRTSKNTTALLQQKFRKQLKLWPPIMPTRNVSRRKRMSALRRSECGDSWWESRQDKSKTSPVCHHVTSTSLCFQGWRWRGIPQAHWPEERQAPGLSFATDGWICGQPYRAGASPQGCTSSQREEEKEEKEGCYLVSFLSASVC